MGFGGDEGEEDESEGEDEIGGVESVEGEDEDQSKSN